MHTIQTIALTPLMYIGYLFDTHVLQTQLGKFIVLLLGAGAAIYCTTEAVACVGGAIAGALARAAGAAFTHALAS